MSAAVDSRTDRPMAPAAANPAGARLPAGFRVRIGSEVWRMDAGRVLVGGAPLRVVRLGGSPLDDVLEAQDAASARRVERLLAAGLAHPDPAELPEVPLGELTVVVPVFGRAEPLERLLAGLHGVRVIVVDDGTPAPAAAAALAEVVSRHGAELLRRERNEGPASARNAGLAASTTPFVAFIDSDVEVDAASLARLLRHFADPGLALIGPRIVGTGGSSWISRYENARSSVDLGARPALVRPRSPVAWISSTCLIARRTALGAGFTAGRRVAEDVDLVWRLAEAGQRVRYEPRVAVRHRHRSRLRTWFARKLFYGTGAADLAAEHPEAIVPAILRPWSVGVLVALLAGRRWSVPVATLLTLGAAWRLRGRLPEMPGRTLLAGRLAGSGALSAVAQLSALALRHGWPVSVALCLISRRARWIVTGFAVVDAEIERRRTRSDLDPARFFAARRLDDIAYGAGVWLGCLRRRSFRALRPELWPC